MNGLSLPAMTWQGYVRREGPMGIRNKVLVIYTVECARFVAEKIAEATGHSQVECIGFSGCTDNQYAVDLLLALVRHPNVGAVLCVGLGCEYVQPERLAQAAEASGRPGRWFTIQEAGGTRPSIEKGCALVRELLVLLEHTPRASMGWKDLIIGGECGGSDYTSGPAGNYLTGRFFDMLVDAGGTAIFEEILEAVGLREELSRRAADEKAREELLRCYDKAMAYCRSVRQYSVSPGNFAGGLSTIEEKSMGAFIKSGSRPIQGVLKVSQRPAHSGLWLLDSTPDPTFMQYGISNPNDSEGVTALLSCGCQLVCFITGRGNVIGSAVGPLLKITGNGLTYRRMEEDMDVDASPLLRGECSPEEMTLHLARTVYRLSAGDLSKSEALGHKEYFIPYKYQDKPRCMQ